MYQIMSEGEQKSPAQNGTAQITHHSTLYSNPIAPPRYRYPLRCPDRILCDQFLGWLLIPMEVYTVSDVHGKKMTGSNRAQF